MLLTKTVITKWNPANIKWYEGKGYIFTKWKDEFEVKVEDLSDGSSVDVNVECNCKECTTPITKPIAWYSYKMGVKEDGSYYCRTCALKLYGGENSRISKLYNGVSFKQWCIENNRQDVLNRWDYDLNNCKPSEIGYSANKKYYFKCPRGIHKSELKNINSFARGQEGSMKCNQCNSFAQWGIDNLGEDFLEKYWDYIKNIVDPWSILKSCRTKVWIKCQEKEYHESYYVSTYNFYNGRRCSYCNNHTLHKLDSLGTLYPEVLELWSNKNNKSPYEYAPHSGKEVWWKCPDGKHKDYKRSIDGSNLRDFRCPECQCSMGEIEVGKKLFNKEINYISQKTFEGLIGLGGCLLSYDFYLPQYNLLIEYQGEMHERFVKGIHKTVKDFEKQVEHDRRKKEYAQDKNIQLLEIWYWEYDKIEEILSKIIVGQFDVNLEDDETIRTASKLGKKIMEGVA